MAETPREPDRFDAQARDLARALYRGWTVTEETVATIAAALRAAEASALERAAQAVEDTEIVRRGTLSYEPWDDAQDTLSNTAMAIRALIPPAAAPAAETRNDPCQRCGKLGGHPVDFRFDGILMGGWICPHCLAAQEKRIEKMEAAIRWACGERPLPDGRWFDPESFGHGGTIPRFWWRSVLYREAGLSVAPPKEPPAP